MWDIFWLISVLFLWISWIVLVSFNVLIDLSKKLFVLLWSDFNVCLVFWKVVKINMWICGYCCLIFLVVLILFMCCIFKFISIIWGWRCLYKLMVLLLFLVKLIIFKFLYLLSSVFKFFWINGWLFIINKWISLFFILVCCGMVYVISIFLFGFVYIDNWFCKFIVCFFIVFILKFFCYFIFFFLLFWIFNFVYCCLNCNEIIILVFWLWCIVFVRDFCK